MPKKLTNKTNLIVKETGRPVFKLDGENVSEKSATIKVDDFYVNLPSIHGNMKYNEDELYDMLMNNEIKATSIHKKHSDAIKAAKERSKNLTIIKGSGLNQGGYGVAGKFTPDTGVSAAKEKGNFEGFGYKGEAKEIPAETKNYGQVTGDPSKDKSESTVSVNKTVKPLTPAPFQKEQFDQYKKVRPQIYPDLKFKQTDKDGPLGYMGQPTGQTLKQRQEEVKRTKKLASLSETKSMAAGRVKNSVFNRLKRISKSFFGPSGRGGKNEIFEDPKNITEVQESMEYWKIKAPMIPSGKPHNQMILGPNDQEENKIKGKGKALV